MRCLLFNLFLFGFIQSTWSQKYIDFQQNRIDLFDGESDQHLAGEINSHTYFAQIDKLQELLMHESIADSSREKLQMAIYFQLANVSANTALKDQDAKAFIFLEDYLQYLIKGESNSYFRSKPAASYIILPLINETYEAKSFIENQANLQPQKVLKNYKLFSTAPYAQVVLSKLLQSDPIYAKQYFTGLHVMYDHLKKSNNDIDKLILSIFQQTGSSSNALSLLQDIKDDKLSIEEANMLSKLNSEMFFLRLVELASMSEVLAKASIDNLLKSICTKKTREVNALFENHSGNERFQSVSRYSLEELYHIIVYSEEEIFTSSFNGMFDMLMDKCKNEQLSNFDLLERVKYNQFRTFLKMCISYGKLERFLSDMTEVQRQDLLAKFVFLDDEKDLLKEAVSVADALGSIKDELSLKQLEDELLHNYLNTEDDNLKLVYTLLMKLFVNKASTHLTEYQAYTDKIELLSVGGISHLDLFGEDARHTQIHCFYDDEDGLTSFQTFLNLWKNKNWTIEDYGEFVQIKSTSGMPFQIFANKPMHDSEGQKMIQQFIDAMYADVDVVVHRGHSFYVSRSLLNLREETKIVLLGSCGGYHQVTDILNRAPSAHIISTKQIGSYTVNNPLIYSLAKEIDAANSIEWEAFWENLDNQFDSNSYAHEKFLEYVPPHQNLGAAFIQAYRGHLNQP